MSARQTRSTVEELSFPEKAVPPNGGSLRGAAWIVITLLGAWAAANWIQTVRWIIRDYVGLAIWDYWRVVQDIPIWKQSGPFRVFWTQHNEHRIPFPEAIELLDVWLLHGRKILPLTASFLCYFVSYLALGWAVIRETRIGFHWRLIAVLLAGGIVGWQGSVAVLGEPFLLQWTMMEASSILALLWIADRKYKGEQRYLVGALIAGVITTYSSGNGLLIWPVLVGAALVLRVQRRDLLAILATGMMADILYFIGYKRSQQLNLGYVVKHPWYLLEFVGSYISMPFGGMKGPRFGAHVGLVALALVTAALMYSFRRKILSTPVGIVTFGTYCFTVLTAVITAAGRMDPSDVSFQGAKAVRYVTVPLFAWGVFAIICIWIATVWRRHFIVPAATVLILVVLAVTGFIKLKWWFNHVQEDTADYQLGALSIENGLEDPEMARRVFPSPEFVFAYLPLLRGQRLSVFAHGHSTWPGRPAASFGPAGKTQMSGEVVSVYPVYGGLLLAGWADEWPQTRRFESLVFVNERGQVAGFGKRLGAGFPAALRAPGIPASLGWVGFVNGRYKTPSLRAYAVQRTNIVPLGNPISYPSNYVARREDLGSAFPGIKWKFTGDFGADALPPGVNFGAAPPGRVFSSWAGSDQHVGTAESDPIPAPASGCAMVPILHGPTVNGLSARVEDADTGVQVTAIPFRSGDVAWSYWRVDLPPATKHYRVAAQDSGKHWGNWIAVSDPAECRATK